MSSEVLEINCINIYPFFSILTPLAHEDSSLFLQGPRNVKSHGKPWPSESALSNFVRKLSSQRQLGSCGAVCSRDKFGSKEMT